MRTAAKIWAIVAYDTFGGIAVSAFLVCAATGIALAVPYDVSQPYLSVSGMMTGNPPAAFFRNLHYWSAQFFLIFTLGHVVEHFVKKTEYDQKAGTWFYLTLSLLPLFFVMLSGFMLKGDPDAFQARQIFSALLRAIPLLGNSLEYSLMGVDGSLQLIYIHHIATATIILLLVIYEHIDRFWPVNFRFLITTFILIIFSYLFSAPLHAGHDDIMKGPWYFVGLQEILHWMSHPGWIWLAVMVFLVLFFLLRKTNLATNARIKQLFIILVAFYVVASLAGYFFRGENWKWEWQKEASLFYRFPRLAALTPEDLGFQNAVPAVMDRREGCLVCHDKTVGLASSHDPQSIGCQVCHGGDPFTLLKDKAHRNMSRVPGNFENAGRACGSTKCHPDIPFRVKRSIMNTLAGMVTVDRYVFGESDTLDALGNIRDIGHSAADQHLRDLCAHCHTGLTKPDPGPVGQLSRGGGCTACHLNYSGEAFSDLRDYMVAPQDVMADTFHHPSLDINISSIHCFGCHSRSGRISTNYEGWHETLLDGIPEGDSTPHRVLDDKRVFRFAGSDVHFEAGMECIDCHLVRGVMGDGELYVHQEQPVRIRCEDCHVEGDPPTRSWEQLDAESVKIIRLRGWEDTSRRYLATGAGEDIIVNAWLDEDGKPRLHRKNSDGALSLASPAEACTRGVVHGDLSCQSCHTVWAPQCIGCHNAFDRDTRGYDLLSRMEKDGSWIEYVGSYLEGPPTLGVIEEPGSDRRIHTFVPGMVLSIDRSSYPGNQEEDVFLRLFAPTSAHTTGRTGRTCKSCHNDPLAMGFGRGGLVLDKLTGEWMFTPRFAPNRYDGLPEDAWTGFLQKRDDQSATRYHMRPFNVEEQRKILLVGACLECHAESSVVMQESLSGLQPLMERLSPDCIAPFSD